MPWNPPPTCDLRFSDTPHPNNLGGFHPNPWMPRGVTFHRVCDEQNTDLNVWIWNESQYQPEPKEKTAFNKQLNYPNVNVLGGTSVDLKFELRSVGNLANSHKVKVGSFYITILDLEHGQAVEAANFKNYTMYENSLIKVAEATSDKYKVRFESTKDGKTENKPVGGSALTKEQEKLGVSMYFEKVSTFHLKFDAGDAEEGLGWNFPFTGVTTISRILTDKGQGELVQSSHSAGPHRLTETVQATYGQVAKRIKHYNLQRSSHPSSAIEEPRLEIEHAERKAAHENKQKVVRSEQRFLQEVGVTLRT